MAFNEKINLYLRLERFMIELDDRENSFAENLRDLMDPLWFSLSKEEREFLDHRGEVELRVLYPITFAINDLFQNPSDEDIAVPEFIIPQNNGVGRQFKIEDVIPCAA